MPGTGLPALRITVGGVDYTYEAENITFSNVDPGGHEMASFDVQANKASRINPGDTVLIMDGLGIVWQGRVAEPAKTIKHGWHGRRVGSATTRVSCEGAGACLKDNAYSQIYVDRDLSQWTDVSIQQQLDVITNLHILAGGPTVGHDPTSLAPCVILEFTPGSTYNVINQSPYVQGSYDARGNPIGYVYYTWKKTIDVDTADTRWDWTIRLSTLDHVNAGSSDSSGELRAVGPGSGTLVATGNNRVFAQIFFGFVVDGTGVAPGGFGGNYTIFWQPAVYGNHGLTGRGSQPYGFYTSDIALHAAKQAMLASGQMKIGRVDTMSQYVVSHYVQYTKVPHDTVIGDMAKLAPAHYGMWESSSTFDETPEFVFAAYGTDATVFTTLADCNEADVSERLANMYTSATINYSDAAGTDFNTTVSLPNAILDRVGIRRTTTLDLGLSSVAAAQVFANFVLQALFAQARTAGSIDLPKRVRNRNGAPLFSYRLKSGLDRIRIADLPSRAGLLTSFDNDSFRISRVESNVDTSSGEITTRVEIDAGVNLIETFQARLTQQTLVAAGGST